MQFPHSVTPVRRLCLTRGRVSMERAAVSLLLGVMASTATATVAAAQDMPPGAMGVFQAAYFKAQAAAKAVTVTPAVVTIDPKANTATFQLVNSSADSVNTTLRMWDNPPGPGEDAATGTVSRATGDSAKNSIISWIKDLPGNVKLAPHETHTVTVHLTVPAGLPSGTYTAYVVGTTDPVVANQKLSVAFANDTPTISKLVYQVGGAPQTRFGTH